MLLSNKSYLLWIADKKKRGNGETPAVLLQSRVSARNRVRQPLSTERGAHGSDNKQSANGLHLHLLLLRRFSLGHLDRLSLGSLHAAHALLLARQTEQNQDDDGDDENGNNNENN